MRRRRRVVLAATFGLACMFATPASAPAAAPGLKLGFTDDATFFDAPADLQVTALAHAHAAQASVIRFFVDWSKVAPATPASATDARDPGWSGYHWETIDTTVRNIAAAGLIPLPVISTAPAWAEGSGRPAVSAAVPAGTWRPSPAALAAFATAAATRYDGRYPDPALPGAVLPRIRYWQGWNEPNLSNYLGPQWRRTSNGYVAESPVLYRRMLNAFYAAIKGVDRSDVVVSAGTAPFGDLHDGDPRMPPARFWRELLCVRGRVHPRPVKCPGPVHFDVLAHHPYPIGPPRRHAINADDVVVPDFAKITRPLAVALRAGTVLPRGAKPIWATEMSWDSRPDPDGLSLADQATYLEGALYVLRHEGVSVVVWYLMRDQAPVPSYATTYQSGIYMRGKTVADDVPKPSFTAFRFPFTAYRYSGVARLWGMAPAAGSVTVQAHQGGRWVTAARLHAGANRVFTGTLRVGQGTALRAVAGTTTSLTWTTF